MLPNRSSAQREKMRPGRNWATKEQTYIWQTGSSTATQPRARAHIQTCARTKRTHTRKHACTHPQKNPEPLLSRGGWVGAKELVLFCVAAPTQVAFQQPCAFSVNFPNAISLSSSGVNRPLVPVAVLVFRRTGSRQSWVVSTFRSRSRSRSRAVLE